MKNKLIKYSRLPADIYYITTDDYCFVLAEFSAILCYLMSPAKKLSPNDIFHKAYCPEEMKKRHSNGQKGNKEN